MSILDKFRKHAAGGSNLPERNYVLGLDWGTSTTKMVLRDYDERGSAASDLGRAYVVEHAHRKQSARYPSTVVVNQGRAYFGFEADRLFGDAPADQRWGSLKMSVLNAREGSGAEQRLAHLGLSLADLATASIAHMILIGRYYAAHLAKQKKCRANVEIMLGMPVAKATDSTGDWYARLAQRAALLADQVGPVSQPYAGLQGVSVEKLTELLASAERSVPDEQVNRADYVRAELAAALYWPYQNPETEEGLYTAVDFGAGTVNYSFYRLARIATPEGWIRRGQISFYAGQCKPPGCDQIDQAIAEVVGNRGAFSLRGHENRYLERYPECHQAVDEVIQSMVDLWMDTRKCAYEKEATVSKWNNLPVLLLGGGSRIQRISDAFSINPHKSATGVVVLPRLPRPGDLYRIPGPKDKYILPYDGDHEMLFVAYGLAIRTGDFAEIHPSDTVSSHRPEPLPIRDVDSGDLYSGR